MIIICLNPDVTETAEDRCNDYINIYDMKKLCRHENYKTLNCLLRMISSSRKEEGIQILEDNIVSMMNVRLPAMLLEVSYPSNILLV